jgi:hypothetical protein
MKKQTPTNEQLDALGNFAANEGRTWKAALRHAWETGDYPTGSDSASLQQVRNAFGPGWLIGFKVRPVGSKYAPADMGTAIDRQDCLTAAGMEQARCTARALIAKMEQDGGRTRIGNTPSCDLCGEQHSEEWSCEEYAADRGWNRVTTIGQVMKEEIDARREALKASIQEG